MAYESYLSVQGKKQGKLKGSSPKKNRADWIPVISFSMGAEVPSDPNSWEPKGHRKHKPLVVTFEACAASPQLLQALYSAEVLTSVVIEHISRNLEGTKEIVVERITLTDAIIVSIDRYTDKHAKDSGEHDLNNLDAVSFRFRQIQVENPIASTSVVEAWDTNNA